MQSPISRILLSIVFLALSFGVSAVPGSLSYQGYLTDPSGSPVNGTVSVTFALYDIDVGGLEQWSELQTVEVSQGLFQVELGTDVLNPFAAGLFDLPLWLGMAVEIDAEMSPRTPLTSVGFAFKAEDAETLSGSTAVDLDQSAHVSNTSNPHTVTAAQVGAADATVLNNHLLDEVNPHGVTDAQTGAADNLASHSASSVHHTQTTSFTQLADQISDQQIPAFMTRDAELLALQTIVSDQQAAMTALLATVAALQQKLQYVSVVGTDMYITGANVYLQNGTGTTSTANTLGNLVIGYNGLREYETGHYEVEDRSGSHNLIVGDAHSYSSVAGVVTGYNSEVNGSFGAVIGGSRGVSSGGVVVGGVNNNAESGHVVAGGLNNTASGFGWSAVIGGQDNQVTGAGNLVLGGQSNTGRGTSTIVTGGYSNIVDGYNSFIGGGVDNETTLDTYAGAIIGGYLNTVSTSNEVTIVGGQSNYADVEGGLVLGGTSQTAVSEWGVVAPFGVGGGSPLDGIVTVTGNTVRFDGVNVQITNGTGTTMGAVNGLGNLIIGNNEMGPNGSPGKTGSHNLVLGYGNEYVSYAGVVSGIANRLEGGDAVALSGTEVTVSGGAVAVAGYGNTVSAWNAVAIGGQGNQASALAAIAIGGQTNVSDASYGLTLGGQGNNATGFGFSATLGGSGNVASGMYSSVSGGESNTASEKWSSVSGGKLNIAQGLSSSVSGGQSNNAFGDYASISGGDANLAWGMASSVSGGNENSAGGSYSSISGGFNNSASGDHGSVSGGSHNKASGGLSPSVLGGWQNEATGAFATVSGGNENLANGTKSSILGGYNNSSSAQGSAVVGGYQNNAAATYSVVTGGYRNKAGAASSVVTGGRYVRP